jgi:hypothetical protein
LGGRLSESQRWSGRGSDEEVPNPTGKPLGERTLGRPRRRWKDNTNVDVREIGCVARRGMELTQVSVLCWLGVGCVEPWDSIAREFSVC